MSPRRLLTSSRNCPTSSGTWQRRPSASIPTLTGSKGTWRSLIRPLKPSIGCCHNWRRWWRGVIKPSELSVTSLGWAHSGALLDSLTTPARRKKIHPRRSKDGSGAPSRGGARTEHRGLRCAARHRRCSSENASIQCHASSACGAEWCRQAIRSTTRSGDGVPHSFMKLWPHAPIPLDVTRHATARPTVLELGGGPVAVGPRRRSWRQWDTSAKVHRWPAGTARNSVRSRRTPRGRPATSRIRRPCRTLPRQLFRSPCGRPAGTRPQRRCRRPLNLSVSTTGSANPSTLGLSQPSMTAPWDTSGIRQRLRSSRASPSC